MLESKVMQLILSLLLVTVVLSDTSENSNSSEFIVFAGRRKLSVVTLGSGVNPSDLPIVKCTFHPKYPTNTTCQVITRDGTNCNVTYFTDTKTEVVSLYQFPGKKVLLHVRQSFNGQDNVVIKDNVTLIDMNNCAGVYNVSLPTKAKQIFPYEDGGYDVVFQDEEGSLEDHLRLDHYDASGQRSVESENVSMHWQHTDIQPVSTKISGRGEFVHGHSPVGNGPDEFKFVNGSQVKDILELNSRELLVSHLDGNKYYTVCGRSRDESEWLKVECARYDMQTNEVFKTQFWWDMFYDVPRHVRGSESGIVLIGVKPSHGFVDNLIIAEARPGEQPMLRRIGTPWRATMVKDNCRILDFDGVARSFTLACEIIYPKMGVAFHKFYLKDAKSWI